MTPQETRDLVLDALRRDLLGPLADVDGHYPGAEVVGLTPGKHLESKEMNRLYVASDGQEVLVAETPTGRYISGALYPVMRTEDEVELDRDQAPATKELTDPEIDGAVRPPEPVDVEDTTVEAATEADLDMEATLTDRPGRPSALGISFVIGASVARLDVHVTGARYEPFDVVVAGRERTAWHRVPIDVVVPVDLPLAGERGALTTAMASGPVTLEFGVHARQAAEGTRTVTCYLVNRTTTGSGALLPCRVLFSAALEIPLPAGALADYPQPDVDRSDEARTLRLLYADTPVRAIGHGVDAVVVDTARGHLVRTDSMPVAQVSSTTPDISDGAGPLAVDMAALGEWAPAARSTVDRMITSYRTWIAAQRVGASAKLLDADLATATRHLDECDAFADDIESGWELAQTGTVHTALRWTSTAMAAQREAYSAHTRKVTLDSSKRLSIEPRRAVGRVPAWRPFQLAFILANLAPGTDTGHPRRGAVDVIWMPTGGGKTEAYLGLAAFTMLHRRLLDPKATGTSVVMRYTLRLLTAQQLQRAASLICALEVIREAHPELGKPRFSIGAWLGQASTPNWRKDALKQLSDMTKPRASTRRPFLLSRCPACATEMGTVLGGKVLGYAAASAPRGEPRMSASCPDPECRFNLRRTPAGLPVFEVDEDIYEARPTFIVATVDKFAQLAWKASPRSLFGIDAFGARYRPAPDLIIQDELHLISGPLGSLVGLYESAIDQLCCHDGGVRPRIVAATATTRAYGRQAGALYDCLASDVRLVPPPALVAGDSFFATTDPTMTPRAHVAVCATGVARFQHTEMRVLASLAHAVAAIEGFDSKAPVDPYWTNVVFFGSLRDLGQAKALLATDARSYAWRLVRSTGIHTGAKKPDGTRAAVRARTDVELTSSSSGEAAQALERLTKIKGERGCVDLALATSVIEVGVDVDRLGLLTIVRQPKTAAQYIQVAGRVGRNAATGPGLVVSILNPLNSRDMSHFERFTSVHDRLYAAVEPASVTPFTGAALTRALRGALTCVVRQTRPDLDSRVTPADLTRLSEAVAGFRDRIIRISPAVTATYDALAEAALREAGQACAQQLDWGDSRKSAFLRKPEEAANAILPSWAVLTSLRSVDVDAAAHIDSAWLPGNRQRAMATPSSEEDAW